MPKDKTYTIKDFIQVYAETQKNDHFHEDFTTYYNNLLAALQTAFNITITSKEGLGPRKGGIYMLFRSTVHSLLAIQTPWSKYLEAGLIVVQLNEAEVVGERVNHLSDSISELSKQNEKLHEEMLEVLFHYLFHPQKTTVTSQELYEQGFDDATEPNMSDYWDYY